MVDRDVCEAEETPTQLDVKPSNVQKFFCEM